MCHCSMHACGDDRLPLPTCCTTGRGPIPRPPWPPRRLLARRLYLYLCPSCRLGWRCTCWTLLTPLVLVVASLTLFRFHGCPMQPSFAIINEKPRYPPAKWPIGHPILPTWCGCVCVGFLIGRGQYVFHHPQVRSVCF